jgi:hypothetical protein
LWGSVTELVLGGPGGLWGGVTELVLGGPGGCGLSVCTDLRVRVRAGCDRRFLLEFCGRLGVDQRSGADHSGELSQWRVSERGLGWV